MPSKPKGTPKTPKSGHDKMGPISESYVPPTTIKPAPPKPKNPEKK